MIIVGRSGGRLIDLLNLSPVDTHAMSQMKTRLVDGQTDDNGGLATAWWPSRGQASAVVRPSTLSLIHI